jgi:hypothetical protein
VALISSTDHFSRVGNYHILEKRLDFLEIAYFPTREKSVKTKIAEQEMLERLQPGRILLAPLIIRAAQAETECKNRRIDALIGVGLPGEDSLFRFAVEAKSRGSLEALEAAAAKAIAAARDEERPLVQVPYLAPDHLDYLVRLGVSGVDLCGNGVVLIPNRLCVVRSGQPNQYRDSRPLNNPFRGRSALVARTLLTEPSWPSLGKMVRWIGDAGADLSLAQASKAIRALEEELIVSKLGGVIKLKDPMRLLDKLGSEWRTPTVHARSAFRLNQDAANWPSRFSSQPELRWAVTGESSASRHVVFSQSGPRRIAVSDLSRAASLLGGVPEAVPNFADLELIETDEPGFFFETTTDENGMRWASRLQTWLELQAGDARQQAAASDLRRQITQRLTNGI